MAGAWKGAFDFLGSGLDFLGSVTYTEQERAEHDLIEGGQETRRHEADRALEIEEERARAGIVSSVQQSGRTRTVALAAVAGVVVLVGGAAMVWG